MSSSTLTAATADPETQGRELEPTPSRATAPSPTAIADGNPGGDARRPEARPKRLPKPAGVPAPGEFDLLPEEADLLRHLSQWSAANAAGGKGAAEVPPDAAPPRRRRTPRDPGAGGGRSAKAAKDKPAPADDSFSVLRVILAAATVVVVGLIVVAIVRGAL